MSQLAWNSIILFAGKVISGIATIAGGIVLARGLSVNDYGTYSQLVLVASTLVFFSNLSLPRSLYYFLPRAASQDEKKHVAVQVIIMTALTSLLFAVCVLPAGSFLARLMQNPTIESSVFFIAVYLFFLSVSDLFEPFLVSLGYARRVAQIEVICGIGLLAAVVLPLLAGIDFRWILVGFSFVLGIKIFILLYYLIRLQGRASYRPVFAGLLDKIRYAAPLAVGSVIGIIGRRIDQMIIASMYMPSEYALYARGAFELPLVPLIPMTISNLMLPQFAKDFADNRIERVAWQFADKARKVALLFFPLAVMMFVLAEAFIVIMFSDKYLESVPVFRIYLLLLPFRITVHGVILRAKGKTSLFFYGDLLFVAVNIISSITLIKMVGMTGAAWGTIIAMFFYTYYISFHNSRALQISMVKLLPWRDLFMIAIVAILSGVITYPFTIFSESYVAQVFLFSCIYIIAYLVMGKVCRIFKKDDIDLLKDLLREKLALKKI